MALHVAEQLESDYSPEHFRFLIQHCRENIQPMLTGDPERDADMARARILRRLDLQLRRASDWATAETDLLALSLRVIWELFNWLNSSATDPNM
jgi:hypothetical protein